MRHNKWLKWLGIFVLIIFIFLNIVAAFHAYKFTHFYGNTTKPSKKPELMSGWEKTETILLGVDYPKRPITSTPANPYQAFQVTTFDGVALEGWYVPKQNAKGTVILFHGHGGNRSGVVNEADAFNNFGYNVCMVDFRAHGNSQGNTCTIGYRESADVKAAYDYVTVKGEKNIILWGISLGAATISKAIVDYKDIRPSKVILEMPFGTLTEAIKGRLRIMHLPAQPFTALLAFWGGVENGFWTFGHNPSTYVRSIQVPVLVQWGKNDVRVTEKETMEIFENIPVKQKRLVVYDESGHQSLITNEREKWISNVSSFLDDK
jgi:alpha-beta hydrolase superfamily lysophospholipase